VRNADGEGGVTDVGHKDRIAEHEVAKGEVKGVEFLPSGKC
jgi:hypothetical protein